MKKSKIIIPAVAVLTLSVAASITGTVAWFTATLQQSFSSNNVVVVNTDGNLSLTMTNVNNTTISENAVTLPNLMPASYDVINSKLSTIKDPNPETKEFKDVQFANVITATVGNTARQSVYYAAQAKGTFSVAAATESNYYLMFDARNAQSKLEATGEVFNSFRVAIEVGTKKLIWGPKYNTTANTAISQSTGMTYISNDTNVFTTKSYTNSNCLISSDEHFVGGNSMGDIEKSMTFLTKTLTRDASVDVKFTYWFEGTDNECVTGKGGITLAAANKIAATLTMSFYALSSDVLTA